MLAPRSVDIIYDTVAQAGTGDLAFDVLKDGGFFATLLPRGLASPGAIRKRPAVKQHFFLTSSGDFHDLDVLRDLVNAGKLRGHIEQAFPISQLSAAINASMAGHTGGKIGISVRKEVYMSV